MAMSAGITLALMVAMLAGPAGLVLLAGIFHTRKPRSVAEWTRLGVCGQWIEKRRKDNYEKPI